MRLWPLASVACLLGAVACWEPQPIAADDPSRLPDETPKELAPIDVAALADEVATVRHLPLKAPIRAQALPVDEFRARFFAQRSGLPNSGVAPMFWSAFGFAPAEAPVADALRRMLEDRVMGFYLSDEKVLFLRGGWGHGRHILPEHEQDRFTLAHEIEHALQDQTFGILRTTEGGREGQLAYRALVEGDAALTEIAVRQQRRPSNDHWMSRVAAMLRSDETQELLRRGGLKASEVGSAPPLLGRMMIFPYRDGLAFVADLYRAGGLKLVNRAFSDPPRTTAQVLHPQKYLAGDRPAPVSLPAPPPGWTVTEKDTMGELATGVLLGQCVQREEGVRAARGWAGDTYAFLSDGHGHSAILWSTIWDDEASASRFEEANADRVGCVRTRSTEDGLGNDLVVRRQGKRVATVQGLGASLGPAVAAALLEVPADVPPPRPPFGPIVIPPLIVPEEEFLHAGHFEDGVWRSLPLGLRMPLPDDFYPAPSESMEAAMEAPGANVAFTMLMTAPGKETDRLYMRAALRALRASPRLRDQSLDYVASGPRSVGGVEAQSHTWRSTKRAFFELDFVPACSGNGTVVLVLQWAGREGRQSADDWVAHFTLPPSDSQVCLALERALE